ncbi:RDD family protein [uncultured Actinomyces sp.]|uniref:RDD family protein n=1 Tax=uncultured Actinomyces sp. TaxID=249061 RepID=UPI0028D29C37|nr:RDD family protein [uncultured Actinomyces sp.]
MSELSVNVQRISDESFISGEGVKLDLKPASPFIRAAAFLIDLTLYVGAFLVLFFSLVAVTFDQGLPQTLVRAIFVINIFLSLVVLPFTIEVFTHGYSLGKWAFNLKVVRRDGGIITARHSFVRAMTAVVETYMLFGLLSFMATVFSPRATRLGDVAAGTMVIQVPEPIFYPPLVMPPDCAQWASHAQVLPIPDELHFECMNFLHNNRQILDQLRLSIAMSLAGRVSAFVSPKPPTSIHPERFLAAVLVVLRDREYAKELKRQEILETRRQQVEAVPFEV